MTKNKKREQMRRCKICVLPETFPGIKFDAEGVCNHCRNFKGEENLEEKKARYRAKFEALIEKYRSKGTYDALLSYSGGKDSTYTLSLLRERYGLKTLALTFDNGFLPNRTVTNIKTVTDKLGADHLFFKPSFEILKKIFKTCADRNIFSAATLPRASTICTACMAMVKFLSLRTAIEKNIPFVFFGWSPGQIPVASSVMKNNPQIVKMMQKSLYEPLYELAGHDIDPYFLEKEHLTDNIHFPYNVSPLVFLEYDEKKIIQRMTQLGWREPKGTDAFTTNCLLNSYASLVHLRRYGYHPYAFEMAKLVREGYLDRSSALKKLIHPVEPAAVRSTKNKLER
jgi:predicted PP-loop superfamily ATPase